VEVTTGRESEAALRIGSFDLRVLPAGWTAVDSVGLRGDVEPLARCSVVLTAGELDAGSATLEAYVASQSEALASWVEGAETLSLEPRAIRGAERVLGLQVRLPGDDGEVLVQEQVYAQAGRAIGVVTLTAPESAADAARGAFADIVAGLRFRAEAAL
jgi:hypothetical protein